MTDSTSDGRPISRRRFLQSAGAGGAAAVGLQVNSPVQRAEAAACGGLCIGLTATGAGLAAGWLLREHEVVGSSPAPEGETPEALHTDVYDTIRTRKSTNASTIVDNRNIIDGASHAAYADGKTAAIEALNDQLSQSEVESEAHAAVDSYISTIESNLLKSWRESVNELFNQVDAVGNHSDLSLTSVFGLNDPTILDSAANSLIDLFKRTSTVTLADGTEMDIPRIEMQYDDGGTVSTVYGTLVSPGSDLSGGLLKIEATSPSGDSVGYLGLSTDTGLDKNWHEIWTDIQDIYTKVKEGLTTWVEGVYGDVQAGELDTSELLTPREMAEMSAEEEGVAQAIADLQALNIPTDLEREAEIRIQETNTTLYGTLAVSSEPSGGVNAGDVIDPGTASEDYYLTYDISQASGNWSAFDAGVDGGTVTFTSAPYDQVLYRINTVAGETAEVTGEDFSAVSDADEWTVDISDQVETQITEIDSVEMYATTEETEYVTTQLDSTFEVVTFRNSDGEEVDSADFSRTTPQDDTNYISEEEWQQMQERQQELIDKYEEAKSGGGGGLLPGKYSLLGMGGVGTVAAGVGGLIAFDRLSGN